MSEQCLLYWARPSDAHPGLRDVFTDAERQRADAYRRPVDRDRFIVGCALSRRALGRQLGLAAREVRLLRDCTDCGLPHGRPRLADDAVQLSVSHSGDWVVVAVTTIGAVGVDVERHNPASLDIAATVLTEAELAELSRAPEPQRVFFDYWTRKEAALKATGDGLRVPMTSVHIGVYGELSSFDGRGDLRLRLIGLDAGPEHSAALAVATDGPVTTKHIDGSSLLFTD